MQRLYESVKGFVYSKSIGHIYHGASQTCLDLSKRGKELYRRPKRLVFKQFYSLLLVYLSYYHQKSL